MTLHKKNGMWISDWANKESDDDQGCENRQMEQIQKAFDLINKMEKQGWKEIGFSGYGYQNVGLTKAKKILKEHSSQIKKAFKAHDDDIKKKWGQKKVKMWNTHLAYRLFQVSDGFLMDYDLKTLSTGELGGCAALMNKGNEYRLIFTDGSNDDESGFWSKPVTQIAFKSTVSKPKAKAPARKPKPAAKKTKPKATTRKSPTISATKRKIGTRMRGNDGFMWEVKKNKNGVHRWVRDSKSIKRAEDYWYWK